MGKGNNNSDPSETWLCGISRTTVPAHSTLMPATWGSVAQRAGDCVLPSPAPPPSGKLLSFNEQRDNTYFPESPVMSLKGVTGHFTAMRKGREKNI